MKTIVVLLSACEDRILKNVHNQEGIMGGRHQNFEDPMF